MVELLPSFADFGHPNVSNLCEEKRQRWRKFSTVHEMSDAKNEIFNDP